MGLSSVAGQPRASLSAFICTHQSVGLETMSSLVGVFFGVLIKDSAQKANYQVLPMFCPQGKPLISKLECLLHVLV